MADYKNGLRRSSEPNMRPPALMVANAKSATEEDVKISAEYFASLKYKSWIRVVETDAVPKTHVAGSTGRRDGADRSAHHRGCGRRGTDHPSRSKVWIHRIRAGRQHKEGRVIGHHWRGQDSPVRNLPWPGPERLRGRAAAGGSLTELCRAPAVRLPERRPRRAVKPADERERRQVDR